MKSPTLPALWQAFAQAVSVVPLTFAMRGNARHCFLVRLGPQHPDPRGCSSTLTPSLRSGPSQAGPSSLLPGPTQAGAGCAKICFEIADIALESAAITTNHRGSSPCVSRLSSLPFSPPRWPVACRTPRRAGLPVPLRALSSPMPPRATCLPALSSAALRASRPAASSLACRPVTQATDPSACGRLPRSVGTIRASRPGGPFHSARC
jgi:hypothetical protein